MENCRIGVIGCGQIAQTVHLKILPQLPGVKVVAIAEVDAKRRAAAQSIIPAAIAFEHYTDLLALPQVDAVVICLPNFLHAEVAIAAMEHGKHVYLEKPFAIDTMEGQRLLDVWEQAGVVGMVGFNYRHNRLYQQLQQQIQAGKVGDLVAVHTTFSTPPNAHPDWKQTRKTGGGVLFDLASHHLDLLQFVLGSSVQEVFAQVQSVRSEADTATLQMRFANGVLAQSFFSLNAVEANQIEICGTLGKLSVDQYQSLEVQFSEGRVSRLARLKNWGQPLSTLRHSPYIVQKLRSPNNEPSFAIALTRFVQAVQTRQSVSPDFRDGYRNLAIIEAAETSARTGRIMRLYNSTAVTKTAAPPRPLLSPCLEPQSMQPLPQLAVVLPTPDTYATIRKTIGYLQAQTVKDQIEVMIVAPSLEQLQLEPADLDGFFRYQVVEVGEITAIAHAYAAGIRQATAPIVALCEDHCFPDATWGEALIHAHQQPWAAVGPVLRNANPNTLVSWADMLIAYSTWMDPAPAGPVEHLPGHNSSYKRKILLQYNDQLEQLMESESLLHWDLRAKGYELYLEPAAKSAHTNFALLSSWIGAQFHAGRVFGADRAREWSPVKRFIYMTASPLIPLVRLLRVLKELQRRNLYGLMLKVLPMLTFGLALDGLGQMMGYGVGMGNSMEKMSAFEFHRDRHTVKNNQAIANQ